MLNKIRLTSFTSQKKALKDKKHFNFFSYCDILSVILKNQHKSKVHMNLIIYIDDYLLMKFMRKKKIRKYFSKYGNVLAFCDMILVF